MRGTSDEAPDPAPGPAAADRGEQADTVERLRAEAQAREAETQYQVIFEATTDGLVINDEAGIAVEVNPAFCEMHGYSREELIGANLTMLHPPESQPVYWEYLKTTADGRNFMTQAPHIHERKDGSRLYVEVRGSTFAYKGKPHILGVVRDITERLQAYELLEQRVAERTRELSTLLDISHNVASILDLEPLLKRILDQLKFVADNAAASLVMRVGNEFVTLDTLGTGVSAGGAAGEQSPLERLGPIWETLLAGEPVTIPDVTDVTDGTPLAAAFRDAAGEMLDTTFGYVRSWLAVPLRRGQNVVGFLALSHTEPDAYTSRHAELVNAIANQAAIAIENARLYGQAQDTARITAALAETGARVAYGGSLESILDDICRHIVVATGASAAAVLLVDEEPEKAYMAGTYGLPEGYAARINSMIASGVHLPSMQALVERRPVVLQQGLQFTIDSPDFAPVHDFASSFPWETLVAAPMLYQDKAMGVLVGYYPAGHSTGEAELAFHAAIADQAAVAVANTRLLAEVQEKAALEQRQHLARELHDSVTQGLFSINLIARSIEVVMQREATQSEWMVDRIGILRQLTQGALAEMRELIFELRPGSLEEEGLIQAIRKHVAAVKGREMVDVVVTAEDEKIPRLKPAAEEALYRITQEALHNIVKHARASAVELTVQVRNEFLAVEIKDNGVGFDIDKVPAGHMGLGTMGERARALGGEYEVESTAGKGTTVSARVPLAQWLLQT